jgi:hypothetical protein
MFPLPSKNLLCLKSIIPRTATILIRQRRTPRRRSRRPDRALLSQARLRTKANRWILLSRRTRWTIPPRFPNQSGRRLRKHPIPHPRAWKMSRRGQRKTIHLLREGKGRLKDLMTPQLIGFRSIRNEAASGTSCTNRRTGRPKKIRSGKSAPPVGSRETFWVSIGTRGGYYGSNAARRLIRELAGRVSIARITRSSGREVEDRQGTRRLRDEVVPGR